MKNAQPERRRYARYVASGDVQLFQSKFVGSAQLVQLGFGGMFMRGGHVLATGMRGTARVKVPDYKEQIEVPFEVARERNSLMAVRFLKQPKPVAELVQWLAFGNNPTTPPKCSLETEEPAGQRCSSSIPGWSNPKDRDATLEYLFGQQKR